MSKAECKDLNQKGQKDLTFSAKEAAQANEQLEESLQLSKQILTHILSFYQNSEPLQSLKSVNVEFLKKKLIEAKLSTAGNKSDLARTLWKHIESQKGKTNA